MTPRAFEKNRSTYSGLSDTARFEAWEIGLRSASRNGSAGIVRRWRLSARITASLYWPQCERADRRRSRERETLLLLAGRFGPKASRVGLWHLCHCLAGGSTEPERDRRSSDPSCHQRFCRASLRVVLPDKLSAATPTRLIEAPGPGC